MQKKWRRTETAKRLPRTTASNRRSVLVCHSSFRTSCLYSLLIHVAFPTPSISNRTSKLTFFLPVLFCIFSNISNRLPKISIQIISKETRFDIFYFIRIFEYVFFKKGENLQGMKTGRFRKRGMGKVKKNRRGKKRLALSLGDAVQVHSRNSSDKLQISCHDRYALGMERVEV